MRLELQRTDNIWVDVVYNLRYSMILYRKISKLICIKVLHEITIGLIN